MSNEQGSPLVLALDDTFARLELVGGKGASLARLASAVLPVPVAKRTIAVLSPAQVTELARIGVQIEQLYGRPMDIEWVLHDGHFFIVQARPITALHGKQQAEEEWNDSLVGDYLWTKGNFGEAMPDVMTPCSWSLMQVFTANALPELFLTEYLPIGNIGGRAYMNLSLTASIAAAFGMGRKRFTEMNAEVFGRIPDDLQLPLIPLSRWRLLRTFLPAAVRLRRRVSTYQKKLSAFLSTAPARCEKLRTQIRAASSAAALIDLWQGELEPFFHHAAIIARELGIPAVVGCGNATMRLHTGDRVRVNGGQGTVEVLEGCVG